MGVISNRSISLSTVAGLEIEVIDNVRTQKELFLSELPHSTYSPEKTIAVILTETGAGIVTYGSIQQILVLETVLGVSEE